MMLLILAAFCLGPAGSVSAAGGQPQSGSVADEVLVRFQAGAATASVDSCFRSAGAARLRHILQLNVSQLRVPAGKVDAVIRKLKTCPGVLYAEPNYEAHADNVIPNDTSWSSQYGPVAIRAPQGWAISTGSAVVTIAIIDTGVDLNHEDLAAKILPGYDFVNNDAVAQDDNIFSHGTHVAGIAAAVTNNGLGVAGISWGARILPVKVLDSSGNGSFANVAAGIVWAVDHGAQVINLSLDGTGASSTLQDAVNYAYSKGVILVAAAGNQASSGTYYPAAYSHVIAVAATDSSNNQYSLSNYGPNIDLSAPGVNIYSTTRTALTRYGYLTGTSMSTAFVSGLAAILRGIPGNTSPDVIETEMESSALDLGTAGRDDYYGYGLIQVDTALAQFASQLKRLSLTRSGNGSGNVTSDPAGLDCGFACRNAFLIDTAITLSASASPGSSFTGWSDPACPGTSPCALTLAQDQSLTATFTLEEYTLTVGTSHGTVTRSPDQPTYHYGDVVRLTPVPAPGYVFLHWSGDSSSSANPLDLTILGNTSLTAVFGTRVFLPVVIQQ